MQVEFEVKEGQKDFSVVGAGMWLSYPLVPAFRRCSYLKTRLHDCRHHLPLGFQSLEYGREAQNDYTSIIQQVQSRRNNATSSFATKYLVVLNLAEAEYVADYILNRQSPRVQAKFSRACSAGLDPDKDLEQMVLLTKPQCSRAKPSRLASCLSTL